MACNKLEDKGKAEAGVPSQVDYIKPTSNLGLVALWTLLRVLSNSVQGRLGTRASMMLPKLDTAGSRPMGSYSFRHLNIIMRYSQWLQYYTLLLSWDIFNNWTLKSRGVETAFKRPLTCGSNQTVLAEEKSLVKWIQHFKWQRKRPIWPRLIKW